MADPRGRLLAVIVTVWLAATITAQADEQTVDVVMETDRGAITLALYPARAPVTVANFLNYVDNGHYDGGTIYRVVRHDNDNGSPKIVVIQGRANFADDNADKDDAPFPPVAHESTDMTGLLHLDATISMARDDPGTATHEFFITIGDQPGLDAGAVRNPNKMGFSAFGRVTGGMDVVRQINRLEAPADVDDAYTRGQFLEPPVVIISVRRK